MPSSQKSLHGAQVVITRVPDRGKHLAAAVEQEGGVPILAPMRQAACVHAHDAVALENLMEAIAHAAAPDWVAVTSVNTVVALGKTLEHVRPGVTLRQWLAAPIRHGVQIAAVGPATAQAVRQAGLPVDALPPAGESSAQGLLKIWPTAPSTAQHLATVYLPQSRSAREHLKQGLRDKGWRVQTAAAYQMDTWPAQNPLTPAGQQPYPIWDPDHTRVQIAAGGVDAVVVTAPSLVNELCHGMSVPVSDTVTAIPFIAIGQPTHEAAQAMGLKTYKARSPEITSLIQALHTAVKEHSV